MGDLGPHKALKRAVVDPIRLQPLRSAFFQTAAGKGVGLGNPGVFAFFQAPIKPQGNHRAEEHQADAHQLVLAQDVRRHQADPLDAATVPKESEEAEREQAAIDRLDQGIVVQQPEGRADEFPVDFSRNGQLGDQEPAQAVGRVADLGDMGVKPQCRAMERL